MNLVVTGHVDHGKSTVVGRLLADTNSLPDGKLDAIRAHCARTARPFEYAFLLDALRDERAQGITIDAARVFFKSSRRRYMLMDAPGHSEFIRNMVTGAARADAAVLVIDAREGLQENSRRHGYLLSLLGIRQVAVVVNKMDLVGHSRSVFDSVAADYRIFMETIGLPASVFVPASGATGENVVSPSSLMGWYTGPTLLQALDQFESRPVPTNEPFRMPVQGVYKFTAGGDERRIVSGTVSAGLARIGDELVFLPSGKKSRIKTFEGFNQPLLDAASAGQATGFTLTDELYLARGEVATRADQRGIEAGTRLRATIFWLGRQALAPSNNYLLKMGTARVPVRLETIDRVLDPSSLETFDARPWVERNEVADCTFVAARPIAFDTTGGCVDLSRFVLVDDFRIAGGGVIRTLESAALSSRMASAWPDLATSRTSHHDCAAPALGAAKTGASEASSLGRPAVVWLTGLSGAGKSTIAEILRARLEQAGTPVELLDGDQLREVLGDSEFSPAARHAHVVRAGFLASRLEHHGVTVICAMISPFASSRQKVRTMCRRFVEVHVATPLEECERRDVKGLYARARAGQLTQFTGIHQPYEAPLDPEITIDTRSVPASVAADTILRHLPAAVLAER